MAEEEQRTERPNLEGGKEERYPFIEKEEEMVMACIQADDF